MNSSGIKFVDLVRAFDGTEDVESWVAKEEMVVKNFEVKNEEELFPILLEGVALMIFIELKEDLKKLSTKIKEKLRETFGFNPFEAFNTFC